MNKVYDDVIGKEKLTKDIIGEIATSKNISSVMKKWRNIFKISQKELANELGITSSVISDYESGRRKNPGIMVIKRYIETLLKIDEKNGSEVLNTFSSKIEKPFLSNAILDMKEYTSSVDIKTFCKQIGAEMLVGGNGYVYGYTVIDALRAITEFSPMELVNIYGSTTQRALIFTGVSTGRGPMVAVKLTTLKPSLIVMHGLSEVDEIAKRIAKAENIPLAICRHDDVEKTIESLKNIE